MKSTDKKPETPSSDSNKTKKRNSDSNKEEDEEDIIEVECHEVEGKPQATPASAKGAHDEDEEDREGVPCQSM